jgi:hypothetical protein
MVCEPKRARLHRHPRVICESGTAGPLHRGHAQERERTQLVGDVDCERS